MKRNKGLSGGGRKFHDKARSLPSHKNCKDAKQKEIHVPKSSGSNPGKDSKKKSFSKEILRMEETQKEVELIYPIKNVSQSQLKRLSEFTKKCGDCKDGDKPQNYYKTLLISYLDLIIENYDGGCCTFNASKLVTLPIFNDVCHRVSEIFSSESTLLMINSETKNENFLILSDLHGCFDVLVYNFNFNYCIPKNKVIILGDYVDKGPDDAFMCFLLFLLKICWPDKIFLLKGNHEVRDMNRQKKFPNNCGNLLGDPNTFYLYNFVFERMPLAAIWNNTVYLAHGGISQWMNGREDIISIKRPLKLNRTLKTRLLITDILWSDPYRKTYNKKDNFSKFFAPSKRGCGYAYSKEGLENIMKYINVSKIIRGHQTSNEGFVEEYKNICYTVHSKPSSCTTTAYGSACQLSLDANNNAVVKQLKYKLDMDKNVIIKAMEKFKNLWKNSKVSPYTFKQKCPYCLDKEEYLNELGCQERILVTHAQIMMWMSNYKASTTTEMILGSKVNKKLKNLTRLLSRFPLYLDFCVWSKIGTSIRPINVIDDKENELVATILKKIEKLEDKSIMKSNPKLTVDVLPFLLLNQSEIRKRKNYNFTSDDEEDDEETFDEKDDSEEDDAS